MEGRDYQNADRRARLDRRVMTLAQWNAYERRSGDDRRDANTAALVDWIRRDNEARAPR